MNEDLVIHLHALLRSPVLRPYRELSGFGLTTASTQREVLQIDMKASFAAADPSLIIWVRQPDRRLCLDFFCFTFQNPAEITEKFIHGASLDPFAEQWSAHAEKNPRDSLILHRLACYYHGKAWDCLSRQDFEGMFAALKNAVPCWAMVIADTDYLERWRKARYRVYDGKDLSILFTGELRRELVRVVDHEIKRPLALPEVRGFSRLRAAQLLDAFERERQDLRFHDRIGGLPAGSGSRAICGPLGAGLFNLRNAVCRQALRLGGLHPDPRKSYLCNIKKRATPEEKLEFQDVQNFRLAFFELGVVFFRLRSGKLWPALSELCRLVGAASLDEVQSVQVPPASLYYLAGRNGSERFREDFYYLAGEIREQILAQEIMKSCLDLQRIRSLLRRVLGMTGQLPEQEGFLAAIEALFLGRQKTILEQSVPKIKRLKQAIALLDIFMADTRAATADSKLARTLAASLANMGALLANQQRWLAAVKYYNRCLELAPGELKRIRETVLVYGRLIRQTTHESEKISYYRKLVQLLEGCEPYHGGDEAFAELYKKTVLHYRVAREINLPNMVPEGEDGMATTDSLEVYLEGEDVGEAVLFDLRDRLQRVGGIRVEPVREPVKEGLLGGAFEAGLSVILGSAAVVQLVKALHIWLQTRRPHLKVKLKAGGKQLELDAKNLPEAQAVIDRVLEILTLPEENP